jgi:hypothetical protein
MGSSKMAVLRVVGVITMSVWLLQAEDFRLNYLGTTPITLHTNLTYEGKGERLIAAAKNESGATIQHAKICILGVALQKACLFDLWNTAPWASGSELNWNVTTAKKVSSLSHDASLVEFDGVKAAEVSSSQVIGPSLSPLSARPNNTPAPAAEILTNETLIKLAKAGVSEDVILRMVNSRPGNYLGSPEAIIGLKEAGVSDGIILAVVNKDAVAQVADTRSTPSGPLVLHPQVEENSNVYIAPMTANLNEFIGAEIVKQHLPVRVVVEEKDADYILSGFSQRTETRWFDLVQDVTTKVVSGAVFGGKDRYEASARLARVRDKTFVWAGESGDRSLIFGAYKRGGQRKLAERIVRQMKRELFP